MGIDLIATVKNSKGITFEEFVEKLMSHEWGRNTFFEEELNGEEKIWSWEAFEWEGEEYFTWASAPRARWVLWELWENELSEADKEASLYTRLTAFKTLKYAEEIAGGPVLADIDVFTACAPDSYMDDDFTLPGELDLLCPNWREFAEEEI